MYDANGNLLYKTDARGFTTAYTYDALNRLVRTTVPLLNASGAVANQFQSTCYQYDALSGAPASANLVGHLVAEWTQSGSSCASSYSPSIAALTAKVILTYDGMGRPLLSQQCIKGMCQASPFTQNQSYDLAGNMTSWTDGRGLMTFHQQLDSAGRPVSLTNDLCGNGLPCVLFSAQGYTPASALQNWDVGGYLNLFRSYDNRLRVTSETVTH
jgi:YD repeat-containing protein